MCNYALSSSLEWSSSSPAALSKEGGRGRDLLTEDSVPTSHPQPPFTQLEIEFYFKSQTVAELLPDRIIAAGMRMIKIDLSNSRQSEGFHLQSQASCCEESSIKAGVGANFFLWWGQMRNSQQNIIVWSAWRTSPASSWIASIHFIWNPCSPPR